MSKVGIFRGIAIGVFVALIGVVMGIGLNWEESVSRVSADTHTTPTALENAVINCGDSVSGHGGSVLNPPTCVNDRGSEVPAKVVQEKTGRVVVREIAGDGDWKEVLNWHTPETCVQLQGLSVRAETFVVRDGIEMEARDNERHIPETRKHCFYMKHVVSIMFDRAVISHEED